MKEQITRRAFFRDIVRGTGISSLVALSTYLVVRDREQACINLGMCRGCRAFPSCGLLPAVEEKTKNGRRTKRDRR